MRRILIPLHSFLALLILGGCRDQERMVANPSVEMMVQEYCVSLTANDPDAHYDFLSSETKSVLPRAQYRDEMYAQGRFTDDSTQFQRLASFAEYEIGSRWAQCKVISMSKSPGRRVVDVDLTMPNQEVILKAVMDGGGSAVRPILEKAKRGEVIPPDEEHRFRRTFTHVIDSIYSVSEKDTVYVVQGHPERFHLVLEDQEWRIDMFAQILSNTDPIASADLIGSRPEEVISAYGEPDIFSDSLLVVGQGVAGQTQLIYGDPNGEHTGLTTWEGRVTLITKIHPPSTSESTGLSFFESVVEQRRQERGEPAGDDGEGQLYYWSRDDGGRFFVMLWDDHANDFYSTLEAKCNPIGCGQYMKMLQDQAAAYN